MKTFLMFGKASSKELKEIGLKYKVEVVSLVENFGGMLQIYIIDIGAYRCG